MGITQHGRFQLSHFSSERRENLLSRAKTLFSKKPEKCANIHFAVDDIVAQITEIETSYIWSKTIVGNKDLPIGRLIEVLQ